MIDLNELRRVAVDCSWPTSPVPIGDILDRLEAAEKERELLRARNDFADEAIGHITQERDALRAKIERMERQEPVAFVDYKLGNCFRWAEYLGWQKIKDGAGLYAIPGAKGEEK